MKVEGELPVAEVDADTYLRLLGVRAEIVGGPLDGLEIAIENVTVEGERR